MYLSEFSNLFVWIAKYIFHKLPNIYLSKLTFETAVSFAVLGSLLEAQMPLFCILGLPKHPLQQKHPIPSNTVFLQKQKLYFSEFLSPIFPNILSSCKWVLHSRVDGYWKYTFGYLADTCDQVFIFHSRTTSCRYISVLYIFLGANGKWVAENYVSERLAKLVW